MIIKRKIQNDIEKRLFRKKVVIIYGARRVGKTTLIREIQKSLGNLNSVLMQILDGVAECINKIDNSEVYLNGTMNILNYPEFKDVLKARDFINLLDTKGVLIDLLNSKSQIIFIGATNHQ